MDQSAVEGGALGAKYYVQFEALLLRAGGGAMGGDAGEEFEGAVALWLDVDPSAVSVRADLGCTALLLIWIIEVL